jgi:chemotaxis protein MotB
LRRRKSRSHENHERWLVSYADFVTLLFAFFVVMFAHSNIDREKVRRFASQFESYVQRSAAEPGAPPAGSVSRGPAETLPTHQDLTMAELKGSIEQLEEDLMPEIQQGKVELSLQPRGLVMSLRESGFFAPGEARLQPEARAMMAKVANSLSRIPGQIRLEGHTDDTPIQTPLYPSNWQLSTARAITVLKLLSQQYGIHADRLAAAGFGEFRPLVANDTAENRAKNRRVDIVILTKDAAAMEPEELRAAAR